MCTGGGCKDIPSGDFVCRRSTGGPLARMRAWAQLSYILSFWAWLKPSLDRGKLAGQLVGW